MRINFSPAAAHWIYRDLTMSVCKKKMSATLTGDVLLQNYQNTTSFHFNTASSFKMSSAEKLPSTSKNKKFHGVNLHIW